MGAHLLSNNKAIGRSKIYNNKFRAVVLYDTIDVHTATKI